jgi:hypothetical protein
MKKENPEEYWVGRELGGNMEGRGGKGNNYRKHNANSLICACDRIIYLTGFCRG